MRLTTQVELLVDLALVKNMPRSAWRHAEQYVESYFYQEGRPP